MSSESMLWRPSTKNAAVTSSLTMANKIAVLAIALACMIASGRTPAIVGGGYRVPTILSVAPGQVITLFVTGAGKHLTTTPVQASDPAGPLPLSLGGISATLHQTNAPTTVSVPLLGAVLTDTCQSLRERRATVQRWRLSPYKFLSNCR